MNNGKAEGRRLSGAGLRARHEVPAGEADGDGVALDGGRLRVLAALDVGHERRAQVDVGERRDGFGDIVTGGFYGDVLVGVEVDPGVLLGLEQRVDLGLGAGVGLEGVFLAVV